MKPINHLTRTQFYLVIISFCLFSVNQTVQAFQTESGDLATVLKAIDYGDKDENTWKQPSLDTQALFGEIFDAFLVQDFYTVDTLAIEIGYELIEFKDTTTNPLQTYYILRESNPVPSPFFIGGGTYVLNPVGANVAIQAPHPMSDVFTSRQAIETFLSTQSKLLFLAGTRRDNSTELSTCTNGSYRKSDSSHYTEQLFYIAHSRASDADQNTVFIQLHGFGTSSLTTLQNQCNTNNNNLINLSEGVHYSSDPSANTFMQILQRTVNNDELIQACVYGNDTSSLGATWTTTGRYTNNSSDSCTVNATTSSERFIHIEQSYLVRSQYRADMAQYLSATITEYFQPASTKKDKPNNNKGRKK